MTVYDDLRANLGIGSDLYVLAYDGICTDANARVNAASWMDNCGLVNHRSNRKKLALLWTYMWSVSSSLFYLR